MSLPTATRDAASPQASALTRFSSRPDEVIGRVIDGRYVVERVLGQGAMAVVLGARHLFLDTPVAVKILHPALTAVTEMRERFLREARVTSGVAHEGLVRVSDFGVSPDGLHYLVMEQLEGEDLLSWSERRGRLGALECAAIAAQVCEALTALHAAGYVHRDLKPENLWVVPGGAIGSHRIKVLDLGIAGLIESSSDSRLGRKDLRVGDEARLTQAGQTLGTPLYMSPEQAIGNPLDQRSDLYSLGCVLWELATDQCAFEGKTLLDIMHAQVATIPPPPSHVNPELPDWFDDLVMRLLAKKPEERFQSAAEAGRAFLEKCGAVGIVNPLSASTTVGAGAAANAGEVLTETGIEGAPTTTGERARPEVRRLRTWFVATAALLAVGAMALTATSGTAPVVAEVVPGRAVARVALGEEVARPPRLVEPVEAGPVAAPEEAVVPAQKAQPEEAPKAAAPVGPTKRARPNPSATPSATPEPTPKPDDSNDGLWQPARPRGTP